MTTEGIDRIAELVPQTYGEALQLYPWVLEEVEPHECDNRTTLENAAWLIERMSEVLGARWC